MPKKEQSISTENMDADRVLSICYSCFKKLDWDILFAGETKLLAQTPKKWNSYPQQVLADTEGQQLTVSSEMTNGEMFDPRGKNQKNIQAFLQVFESLKNTITEEEQAVNTAAITALREKTLQVAEQEIKEASELDAAMNLSGSNMWVTYGIIAINTLVFVMMAFNGAGIFEANSLVHIKWGSNYGPLTLSGDWWRLITCVFLHFGIIHLAMNMYSLYYIGIYLEPMLGKTRYIIAYLCTGIFASLASLWWHGSNAANSAGASGAIFGMYGLFLALLTTSLIPAKVRNALLQSIGIFVLYNLAYGLKSGVDNAAHVGGLLSGFITGYIYSLSLKKEKQQQPALQWVVPFVIVVTLASTFYYLRANQAGTALRKEAQQQVTDAGYKDNDSFNDALKRFSDADNKALLPFNDTTVSSQLKDRIEKESVPAWEEALLLAKKMQKYDVSPQNKNKAATLEKYIELRKEQVAVYQNYFIDGRLEEFNKGIEETNRQINTLLSEIQ